MIKSCVTHHHACDCREEYFASLVDANEYLETTYEDLLKEFTRVATYHCDADVFPELQAAIAKLEMRVKAAEKLLKGFTASDLCGANEWAYDACDELLREFWD